MLISRFRTSFALNKSRRQFSIAIQNDEYTAKPEYPPIVDTSIKAKHERRKLSQHEEIKAVKTVEEKQIKLNMPQYYGFKTYLLPEDNHHYNTIQFVCHSTRTHLINCKSLPPYYSKLSVEDCDIKSQVEEAILLEFDGYRKVNDLKKQDVSDEDKDNFISMSISRQLNRIILNKLSKRCKHLSEIQVDIEPRIESTWTVGGMDPPENVRSSRRGREWSKAMETEPTDRIMSYVGSPNLTLRSTLPLLPIIPHSESDNTDFIVPFFKYDPRVIGIKTTYRPIMNTPGFWPGDPFQFGIVSYHRRGYMFRRHPHDQQDYHDMLHSQAVLSSFAWVNAQANFLGFTTYNDITYPLVSQAVVTNGKLWSFYVYQLNTLLLHSRHTTENPKRNVCWATTEMKLFDDIQDEKVVGLNEDVLKVMLQFYANAPEERLGINLKPYLDQEVKVSADYDDDEKREWLEREFKHLVSNRPRHKLSYELYHWEKIYKVDHPTRFMEPRRRPFELKINPYQRKLNERKPKYIPRALRPDLPKNKGRDAKEFFP